MSTRQEIRRRSALDRTAEALGSGLGRTIGWLADHGVLFAAFAAIWAAVLAGLLLNEAAVSQVWSDIGSQHVVVQALLWLLFLPVMAGLWIWHTDWPIVLRALLVFGLAGWNLLVFLPRRTAPPPAQASDGEATAGG